MPGKNGRFGAGPSESNQGASDAELKVLRGQGKDDGDTKGR